MPPLHSLLGISPDPEGKEREQRCQEHRTTGYKADRCYPGKIIAGRFIAGQTPKRSAHNKIDLKPLKAYTPLGSGTEA
jgi:hypothetical protein